MVPTAAQINTAWEWVKLKLRTRRQSYRLVFGDLRAAHTKAVLQDLASFCRLHVSAFHPDPRVHAVFEGRREVLLRILYHLNLTEEDFFALYRKEKF